MCQPHPGHGPLSFMIAGVNQRKSLPDALSTEAFRVAAALAAGASRKRLRAHDLTTPFRGVRSSSTDLRRSVLPLMAPGDAFCGPTAAQLWRLPLPLRNNADRPVHVSLLGNRRMRRPGVVSSRRDHGIPLSVGGLPVLDPIATWMSLGGILSPPDLTAVLDRLVSGTLKTPALASLEQVDAALDAAGSPRWIRRLRAARVDARVGAWSRPETLLRLLIVGAGLPEPTLNSPVDLIDGAIAYPDLAWPEFRIVIEYDGQWHTTLTGQGDSDADRHERLVDAGWMVVRVRAAELFDQPSSVIARLVRRLGERGFVISGPIEESRMARFTR
jgi:hypothetical protein